jgi:hypothetical protein
MELVQQANLQAQQMVAWMIGSSPRLGAFMAANDPTGEKKSRRLRRQTLQPNSPAAPKPNSQGKTKQP